MVDPEQFQSIERLANLPVLNARGKLIKAILALWTKPRFV